MSERPVFRRSRQESDGPLRAMVVLLVLVGGALLARPTLQPAAAKGTLVEVRGDVARPGLHRVEPATTRAAVAAAGGHVEVAPAGLLHHGDRIEVHGDVARVRPASDPLLVGLPVDLNTADAIALAAIPGVGPETAEAVVSWRRRHGSFGTVHELQRVPGVGPSTVALMAPFVTTLPVGPPPPTAPLNLNSASASALERLPGIGPVLAARIVVERAEGGPFRTPDDLVRVQGVGPRLLEKVRPFVDCAP